MADKNKNIEENILVLSRTIISQTNLLADIPPANIDVIDDITYSRTATAERLTFLCRDSLAEHCKDPEIVSDLSRSVANMKIDISYDGYLSIELPILLPKRKWADRSFIDNIFSDEFTDFVINRKWEPPSPCTIVFEYGYAEPSKMRDYDNMESKGIVDTIINRAGHDDNPRECNTYYCAVDSDRWYTKIFVMTNKQFADFIVNREA